MHLTFIYIPQFLAEIAGQSRLAVDQPVRALDIAAASARLPIVRCIARAVAIGLLKKTECRSYCGLASSNPSSIGATQDPRLQVAQVDGSRMACGHRGGKAVGQRSEGNALL